MSWLIPRDELTPDQLRAVELAPNEHRVILGAPGSGKTQVLLHRARFLIDEYNVHSQRFHIFVFTNVLKEYIRTALGDLELSESSVTTLDDWCVQIYRREVGLKLPKKDGAPNFAQIRRKVHEWVKRQHWTRDRKRFEFVLVDEGQDLDSEAFALLCDIATHLTVAMDHKQQIYEKGCDEPEVVRTLGLRRSNINLLEAFRCCPYVIRVASEFVDNASEREAFLKQTRTAQSGIQTPLLYEAEDIEDERAQLINILRERQIVDQRIAILFSNNAKVESFAGKARAHGLQIETRKSGLDFSSPVPKALTIWGAKGLTFDSVFMPRLVPGSFSGQSKAYLRRLLFVGFTRATRWLYLSTIKDNELPELSRVSNLAKLKPPVVTIRSCGLATLSMPKVKATDEPEDELVDIL